MTARIVVVGDNAGIRETLVISLSGEGWEVFGYSYAQIGLTILDELQPDLMLIDFNIRNGAGWELLQLLKMEATTAVIPIFITTIAAQLSVELQGYLLAQDIRIINKPFDLDMFLPLVHRTLALATHPGHISASDPPLPILVVEDSEDLREALTLILQLEGYQVATAENGLIALDALNKAEHCLIFLDLKMPIMDGFEFLKMYGQQLKKQTPVVILSAEEDILSKVFPSFVIGVLPKPYHLSELLSIVKRYALPV